MVAAVRRGKSMRSIAGHFAVSLSTVQHWCARAKGKRLDRVDWEDGSSAPNRTQRTKASIERRVLSARKRLKEKSDLGEYGAHAIHRDLQHQGVERLPCIRTIGRILERHGVLDGRKRVRRPAPPKGWYLPDVADSMSELDSFDTIEGLAIRGGPHLTIFTGISLHGGLAGAWPERRVSAKSVVETLLQHWRGAGLPAYAQFDNDNRFTGPRQYLDAIGRVIRMCLNLQVTPVFVVPNETGFQATIESFNGRWQAKVWSRFQHSQIRSLRERSEKYIAASRERNAARIEAAPARRQIPKRWKLNLQATPRGRIVYLRRTNDRGYVNILGHPFSVDPYWVHRLIRAEVDLDNDAIKFFALRRRAPNDQSLLNEHHYQFPNRLFKE